MSLTVADLPAILADLARLEPTRFRASGYAGEPWDVWLGDFWSPVSRSLRAADLITVQAAVQEAITARGWSFALIAASLGSRAVVAPPEIVCRYLDSEADGFYHDRWLWADHEAVALASAFREALLAVAR